MKQSLIILLISVCAANAQMWTNVETGAVAPQPSRRPADAVNVSEEWFILPGWQPFSLAQQAAWDAAEAVAQAEAEEQQAAQASLPATFPTGISVTNEAGHWVEFIPDGTNVVAQTLAIQVSQSPLTPEQRNQMRQDAVAARSAKRSEAKAAKKNGKLQDRIAALEALLGVE